MNTRMIGAGLALLLAAGFVRADDKVEITTVKLDALHTAIGKHKGKVVVIDFWATFCLPCKKEFPNLVKLHKQKRADLVCISVSVDETEDKSDALKFLKDQKAVFENYLLDEKGETYQKEFDFGAVPCVLVIGKDGKVAKKFTDDNGKFTYADVRKEVDALLK